jgi:hypothetical protein
VQLGHLPGEERDEILDILAKHRSKWSGRLGQVQSTNHRIDLIPGQNPVHCQPYRAGPRARAIESAVIQRILKAEVIEPATSKWASPIVLVAKPDGFTRVFVDYVLLSKLGRGEGRDCIYNRLNPTRSRDRDKRVAGGDERKGE